jgi:hypothetical protein
LLYAREAADFQDQLQKHLAALNELIKSWYDRDIQPGDSWEDAINEPLKRADIILFPVSVDLSSRYCVVEMARELGRAKKRRCRRHSCAPAAGRLRECPVSSPPSRIFRVISEASDCVVKGRMLVLVPISTVAAEPRTFPGRRRGGRRRRAGDPAACANCRTAASRIPIDVRDPGV